MFDITVVDPMGSTTLARSGERAGYALKDVMIAKTKYGGTYRPTYKCIPLVFFTCFDDFASVNDLVKDLDRIKVEMDEEYLMADEAGKLLIHAREIGRLYRHPSLTTRKALEPRTLTHFGRQ